tara:strand:- start:1526 stop:2470 length:945 start_codon:yes stop_codon:yes gene_type:complete
MYLSKPRFWNLKKPNLLSYLLKPFTLPVKLNNLFLKNNNKEKSKKIKTICIGNIYIGGTGKTPTVIKLFQILKKLKLKVSTGKKYYSSQLDEQILLKKKTDLIIDHKRSNIIKKAIKRRKDLLVFDDGLQDRKIHYDLQFVCMDVINWIGNGCLIPAGPLREETKSLKKYDAVFLKNSLSKNSKFKRYIKKINSEIKIFNTFYKPLNLKEFSQRNKYLIFSGIGNPDDFKKILSRNKINIVKELVFPDHFNYDNNDINKIKIEAKKMNAKIITTEKDYVKIPSKNKSGIKFLKIDLTIQNKKELINFLKLKINE